MKTADFTPGTVYAYVKDSYTQGNPVLALDNKLWTMGGTSGHGRATGWSVTPAQKGDRPNDGGWRVTSRRCGVPVLMIDQTYDQFTDLSGYRADKRITESPAELFAQAMKKMGITGAEDLERAFERGSYSDGRWNPSGKPSDEEKQFRSAQVTVTHPNGTKGEITVHLTTIRPQTVPSDWETFDADKRAGAKARMEYEKAKAEKEARQKAASQGIKARLDALLGEVKPRWSSSDEREDCFRTQFGNFSINEETLLRLLELAEKGAEQ